MDRQPPGHRLQPPGGVGVAAHQPLRIGRHCAGRPRVERLQRAEGVEQVGTERHGRRRRGVRIHANYEEHCPRHQHLADGLRCRRVPALNLQPGGMRRGEPDMYRRPEGRQQHLPLRVGRQAHQGRAGLRNRQALLGEVPDGRHAALEQLLAAERRAYAGLPVEPECDGGTVAAAQRRKPRRVEAVGTQPSRRRPLPLDDADHQAYGCRRNRDLRHVEHRRAHQRRHRHGGRGRQRHGVDIHPQQHR